jgi:DNA-binding NtrC family response regulator
MGMIRPINTLLVEDDTDDAEFIQEVLSLGEHYRYDIRTVGSLREAELEVWKSGIPDLVILDLNLPDSLYLDTVKAMVQFAPSAIIVVTTGISTPDLKEEIVAIGAYDLLVKWQREDMDGLADRLAVAVARNHVHGGVYEHV